MMNRKNVGPSSRKAGMGEPGSVTIPFDSIHAPGSYVCNWNGHLLRVPDGGLMIDGSQINLVGPTPLFVTKISDDPQIPLSRARELASECCVTPSF
jgi:hypothetical protein